MVKANRYILSGVLAAAVTLSLAGPAQAEGDESSSAWALGNLLHGLAAAMTGSEMQDQEASGYVSPGTSPQVAAAAADQESALRGTGATSKDATKN